MSRLYLSKIRLKGNFTALLIYPDQILIRIQGTKQAVSKGFAALVAAASNGLSIRLVCNVVKAVRSHISNHEQTARKFFMLIELLTVTKGAKNTMEARSKFMINSLKRSIKL